MNITVLTRWELQKSFSPDRHHPIGIEDANYKKKTNMISSVLEIMTIAY